MNNENLHKVLYLTVNIGNFLNSVRMMLKFAATNSDLYIEHFQTTGFSVLKNREIQMK